MSENYRNLLSLGALLIIAVAVILLTAFQIIDIELIVPIFLVLVGCWTIMLAFIKPAKSKYGMGTFGTVGLGAFLVTLGFAWYIFAFNWLFALASLLFVLGGIAIAAAIMRK